MKVLGIHYFFPPDAVVGSRRLLLLYRALAPIAKGIFIISSVQGLARKEEVAYQHDWPVERISGKGLREYLAGGGATSFTGPYKQNRLFQVLTKLRNTFPLHYFTGEGGVGYQRRAYASAVRIIQQEGISHILTSFRPWADHLVAQRLKQRFPHLIWLADFRDLPIDPIRKDVYWPALQKRYAQNVLREANQVWAVSSGQAKWLQLLHPNVTVMPGGLEALPVPTAPRTKQFIINYSGSLYRDLQNVEALQKAVITLLQKYPMAAREVSINYQGKDASLLAEWMSNTKVEQLLEAQGPLPLARVKTLQAKATINLLLSWSGPGYSGVLTAKLYDYLAAGRPIMALVNGPHAPELRQYIEGSGAGIVIAGDREDVLFPWLETQYLAWKKGGGTLAWTIDPQPLQALFVQPHLQNTLATEP